MSRRDLCGYRPRASVLGMTYAFTGGGKPMPRIVARIDIQTVLICPTTNFLDHGDTGYPPSAGSKSNPMRNRSIGSFRRLHRVIEPRSPLSATHVSPRTPGGFLRWGQLTATVSPGLKGCTRGLTRDSATDARQILRR